MSIREELENVVPAKLAVERVSKRFFTGRSGEVHALDAVSLQVNVGGFLCLVGPSGCGKSTLLNIIAGLEKPDSGQMLADGKPIPEPGRDRMVMFQEPALFPWLDVMGNVLFGLKLKPGLNAKERREVAEFYLRLVGLERFMHATIHQLSGGTEQRVARARALAPNPGRIREEFKNMLERPRAIISAQLASYSTEIMRALTGYVTAEVAL